MEILATQKRQHKCDVIVELVGVRPHIVTGVPPLDPQKSPTLYVTGGPYPSLHKRGRQSYIIL